MGLRLGSGDGVTLSEGGSGLGCDLTGGGGGGGGCEGSPDLAPAR